MTFLVNIGKLQKDSAASTEKAALPLRLRQPLITRLEACRIAGAEHDSFGRTHRACFAADAPASLIEVARVVDARVDHFTVARADPGPDAILAFDDDDLASRPRKSLGGCETDNSGSENEAIDHAVSRSAQA